MAAGKTKKPRSLFRRTMLLMILTAAIAGLLTWLVVSRLEQGVLDVCAVQQDAYVQLVLDQINLQQDRDDREIIDDILGTLDASSSKYWVFSKGETMLFVKDVMETNKYKGFTTATYYDSASAKEFLDSLQMNHVRHGSIQIDGKPYIASGAAFSYSGEEYRLCLLTNRSIMLENNSYLRVKSEMWVMALALLLLLVSIPASFARKIDILRKQREEDVETIAELHHELTAMNDRFANRDWYDTETSLWQGSVLPRFAERIAQREFSCVTMAHIRCEREEDQLLFLSRAHLTIPKTTLRFSWAEHDLVLLFLNTEEHEAWRGIVPLLGKHVTLDGRLTVARTGEELAGAVRRFTGAEQGA